MNKPTYQKIIIWATFICSGALALATLLDAINNALSLISPRITIAGSLVVILFGIVVEVVLRKHPIVWITKDGQSVRLKNLNIRSWLTLGGFILLLWVPWFIKPTQVTNTGNITPKPNDLVKDTVNQPNVTLPVQPTMPISTQMPAPSTSTPMPPPTVTPIPVTPTFTPTQAPVIRHPGMVNLLDVNQRLPAGWVTRGQFTYWEGYIHVQDESFVKIIVKGCEDDEGNGWLDLIQVFDPQGNAVVYKVNCRTSYKAVVDTHGKAGYYRIYLHDNDTSSSDGNGGTLEVDMLLDQIVYVNPS